MSAESDLRADLIADAALLAGLGTVDGITAAKRICIDAVSQDFPRPYIVFSKQNTVDELGSDNTLLAELAIIDIQCVGTTRSNAISIRDLVRAALRAAGTPSDRGSAGFDAENGLEVEVVTVDRYVV